ncbi:MAG: hypothetical protein RLZZ58_1243 [Pseudomonadota bacterium]
MKFADLGLSDELMKAVTEAGYDTPTPIQASAIPSVLMMRDIIGIAQTGTGKTASFVLPMIDILAHGRARARMPRSLILEPTRELAAQVAENFEKYGKYHKLSMALLIGGVQMGDQVKALEKGVDVLIATPGRLMDLFDRGKILLNGCSMLVIDEADRMLDMGFIPDIETICTKLPAQRQTLLFSATMPPPIKKLSDRFLSNPKSIEVARPASANVNIAQFLVKTSERGKRDTLRALLRDEDVSTAIVFCNRKTTVRDLAKALKQAGFKAGEIHGDMEQPQRLAELDRFKAGTINVLVASDVAARGLDVKGVSHVFNYDAPWHPDDYIHRIGRTGRAGAKGRAFTLVAPSDDEAIAGIKKLTGVEIPYHATGDAPVSTAAPAPAPAPASAEAGDAAAPMPRKRPGARGAPAAREARPARDERPARDDRPARDARPAREERPAREPRPPRDERPAREARPPAVTEKPAPRKAPPRQQDNEPDDGWNGPMPGFLGIPLNR